MEQRKRVIGFGPPAGEDSSSPADTNTPNVDDPNWTPSPKEIKVAIEKLWETIEQHEQAINALGALHVVLMEKMVGVEKKMAAQSDDDDSSPVTLH